MRYVPRRLKAWPRLIIDNPSTLPEGAVGYLQTSATSKRMVVGAANGRQFRLMQCLWSPCNFPTARYEPVTQTYERLFAAMGGLAHAPYVGPAGSAETEERHITHTVEKSLSALQHGVLGGLVRVALHERRAQMTVAAS